ncbi:MAG: ECF-type sigma factor [Blastocatellia bacterium]
MPQSPADFSTLLQAWRAGDAESGERLICLVYDHLHWLAQNYLGQEGRPQSIQPTDLVNETYLRLFGSSVIELADQSHFFVIAARQMRRILIDRARSNLSGRKPGPTSYATLDEAAGLFYQQELEMLALDEALDRLEEISSRAAQVVELRYFAGLTEAQAAEVLGISVTTLKRDWNFARLWLHQQLSATIQPEEHQPAIRI